jgi:hypothetical protein
MKKYTILLLAFLFLSNSNIYAQKKGEGALAAAGVLEGIGAAALAVEQMKEELELFATNYVLETYNLEAFKLKVNGLGSKSKAFDVSSVATYAFNVTPLELEYKNPITDKQFTLVAFFDSGWRNEFGIDVTKVKFFKFDKESWVKLYSAYLSLAAGVEIMDGKVPIFIEGGDKIGPLQDLTIGNKTFSDSGKTKELRYTELTNRGLEASLNVGTFASGKTKFSTEIILPFDKIDGDTYLAKDYSEDFKVIFNEKSLGLFLKDVNSLVQIKKSLLKDINDFVLRGI